MKKLLTLLLVLVAALCTAFAFSACDLNDLFGETNNDNTSETSPSGGDNTSGGNSTPGGNNTSGGNSTPSGNNTSGGNSTPSGNNTSGGNSTPSGNNTSGGNSTHVCSYELSSTVEADCTNQGYDLYACTCGKTDKRNYKKALGHDYKNTIHNATCTTDWSMTSVCSRCNDTKTETVPDSKAHDYGEYKTNYDATCVKDGTKSATCKKCGVKNTIADEGSATGEHIYGAYKSNNDATCVKDGTKTAACVYCKAENTITDEGTASGEHTFGTYYGNNDGTCTKDGTATAKCEKCGATDTKTVAGSKKHDYTWKVIKDECDRTEEEGTCKKCGNKEILVTQYYDAWFRHDFNWTETHNATCTVDGFRKGTCKKCGIIHTEFLKAEGHKAGSNNKCTVCGETVGQHTETINAFIATGNYDKMDFGMVSFEFVLINPEYKKSSGGSTIMLFDLYVVQSYTKNGKTTITREKVTLDTPDHLGSTFTFNLRNSIDNKTVKLNGVVDYSVDTANRNIYLKLDGNGTVSGIAYQYNKDVEIKY